MAVRVQHEDFDVGVEIARLRAGNPKIGAVASFVGVVRDLNEGADVAFLTQPHMYVAGLPDELRSLLWRWATRAFAAAAVAGAIAGALVWPRRVAPSGPPAGRGGRRGSRRV